ncbi:uncharacterized protein MEPE_02767 [Melanopsichium pennsylvanicum]|uniref:Uncharacterized protein n=2 Tax=Melanopsichium pennsylvanicum TaxID=63383 RepID=A0AAJ5C513_9BASI|nr:uncharacterized protein BN887_00197 [Melanopsichium pennsylvanicum 4]SNX84059.1 uncharacterized protein MEPE_02767 [Melanopsichium pennsylvanicum]
MKLLLAFAGLLLALQIVGAVQSEHLNQPRLIKVKSSISTLPPTKERLNLQRRGEEEVYKGVGEIIRKFEDLPKAPLEHEAPAQSENFAKGVTEAGSSRGLSPFHQEALRTADRNYAPPNVEFEQQYGQNSAAGNFIHDRLGHLGATVDEHALAIENGNRRISQNTEDIYTLAKGNLKLAETSEQNAKLLRAKKWVAGSAMAVSTTAALTSAVYAGIASNKFGQQDQEIKNLNMQIARLNAAKELQQQQVQTYHNGAGYMPGSGVPATSPQYVGAAPGGVV